MTVRVWDCPWCGTVYSAAGKYDNNVCPWCGRETPAPAHTEAKP